MVKSEDPKGKRPWPVRLDYGKIGPLTPGLYLVGTPIGKLEDITFRALRLKSANVILSSEDTRHSGKLLQYQNSSFLKRLKEGEILALISDVGTPGMSDLGMELAKLCVGENIPVISIPGTSAVVAALPASGLAIDEFTFVRFLPKHFGSRKERLIVFANEARTQIFFVPPHQLCQFLEQSSSKFLVFQVLRGALGEAKEAFSTCQPKGEITLFSEGKAKCVEETPSECQLENELRQLISSGHSLSSGVKLVAERTSMKKKTICSLVLRKVGKQIEAKDSN